MKVKKSNNNILLSEVIELISGRDLTKSQYNAEGKGIPYIMGASNIKDGKLIIERWTANPTVIGNRGDIIISVKGTVGQFLILNEKEAHLSRQVMALRVKDGYLNEYIRYFLAFYIEKLKKKAKGMIPGITRDDILSAELPGLELEKQKEIIKTLKISESLIQKRKAQIEAMRSLSISVFIEMFGDPILNNNNYKYEKLSNLTIKITDGTHHSPPMVDVGVPYISAKHLGTGKLDFYRDPVYVSEEEHMKIYQRCDPRKGDVLYIKDGATTGIAAINHYDFQFSMLSSLALIKCKSEVLNNIYLIYYLNNQKVKEKILNNMSGGAIKRLTLKKINDIDVMIPPIELQKEFSKKIMGIDEKLLLLNSSLEQLENNFESLLQDAYKAKVVES